MSGKMRYSLQTWPRRAARAGGSTAGPGGARRGAKTAGTTPTTGCVTPPGGVGVERRRDILLIVAPSLRNDTIWSRGPKSGDFPHVLQVHPQSRVTERESAEFLCVAPLPHHLGG